MASKATPDTTLARNRREIALCAAGLVLLAAAVFGPHVSGWGAFSDDWADAAGRFYPAGGDSFGNVMSNFSATFGYRPVLVVYTPLKYFLLGANMSAQFAWTIALGVLISVLLFGILRRLGVPAPHAGAIAALALIYPWFDSTRLWESANPAPLSISLAMAGFWVALVGLDRRSWRLHAVALALYLVSVLAYELTLPLIMVAGVVYTVRAGWVQARLRWAADVTVVIAGGLWVGTHTTRTVSGISADLSHLGEIVEGAGTIVARTVLPLGQDSHKTLALVALAALFAAGVVVYALQRSGRSGASPSWGLREWLLLALTGACVAALGWLIFIPADPYYTPSVFGVTNRVNGLAGYGLVILAYAAIGTGCNLFASLVPAARRLAPVAPLVFALLLAAAYVQVLDRHIRLWESAAEIQRQGIRTLKAAYPRLPPNSVVFTSGFPVNRTAGVPIFSAPWDVNGMVKLEYGDGTLSGYPMLEGMAVDCRPDGVALEGSDAPAVAAPYGDARLIDLETGEHSTPRDRRQCRAVAGRYVPGPMYLDFDY